MLLPQTAEYALRAVVHIAQNEASGPVRVSDIAQALDVPRNYLSKTLHQLSRDKVLSSARGPLGGFRLAISPDQLTLMAVVAPFTSTLERHCLLGRARCRDSAPCAAHERWKIVGDQLAAFFAATTIRDLMDGEPAPASRRVLPAASGRSALPASR